MKRILIFLLIIIFLVGCGINFNGGLSKILANLDENAIYLEQEIDETIKLLPGNESFLSSRGDEGSLVLNYNTITDIKHIKWEKNYLYKEVILYNSSILFSKDNNIKTIYVYLNTEKYQYSVVIRREGIEKYIFSDLSKLNKADTLKREEFMDSVIDEEKLENYFYEYSVLKQDNLEDC